MDYLTYSEAIDFRKQLKPSPAFIGPKNFHDRCGVYLPQNESKIQRKMYELKDFVTLNSMYINSTKTKIQPFGFSRNWDFTPKISYDNEELEVVYCTKLLGVYFESTCKLDLNAKNLVLKSNPKPWFLRRPKNLGASKSTLLKIYKLFIPHYPRQTLSHGKKFRNLPLI